MEAEQNGHHLADILKRIFIDNVWIVFTETVSFSITVIATHLNSLRPSDVYMRW